MDKTFGLQVIHKTIFQLNTSFSGTFFNQCLVHDKHYWHLFSLYISNEGCHAFRGRMAFSHPTEVMDREVSFSPAHAAGGYQSLSSLGWGERLGLSLTMQLKAHSVGLFLILHQVLWMPWQYLWPWRAPRRSHSCSLIVRIALQSLWAEQTTKHTLQRCASTYRMWAISQNLQAWRTR